MKLLIQEQLPMRIKARCGLYEVTLVFATERNPEAKAEVMEQIMAAYRERKWQEVK